MQNDPACAVCGERQWESLGRKRFKLRRTGPRSRLTQARIRVLFEIWAPGQTSIDIEYVLCSTCGFVCYRPRPTADEVTAKYVRGLRSSKPMLVTVTSLEQRRSRSLCNAVEPFIQDQDGRRILDFGGGSGALMLEFHRLGLDCCLVDFETNHVPLVRRLADTLEELADNQAFDLIVASHVLEHLAEPLEATRSLARRLSADGLLFVEVPLEIRGHPPRQGQPVTHINFFSEPSLTSLLNSGGLRVLKCWTTVCTSASGYGKWAVRAVAVASREQPQVSYDPQRVRELLRPNRLRMVADMLRHPTLLLGVIGRFVRMLMRR
jgi:2-polyprenyl-3-methyl-5-hydroxy-6-metoxy-1,4-benzoquinol methylase